MAQIETWYKQDLTQPIHVHHLPGNVFSQDNQGNIIGVEVFEDGVPASLSGTVTANIVRSDGGTVAATGTLSGNKLSVTLPAAAYAVPGVISIVLKLTTGAIVVSLLAVVAVVYASSTDTPIDPGAVMPSIEELIAEIDAAVATIPLDYSALVTAVKRSADYNDSFAARRYEKQIVDIIGKIKMVVILPNSDDYNTPSARAVYYLVNSEISNKVTIYANNNFPVGVIKRNATDYSYIGYVVELTDKRCISFTPEAGYIYGVLYGNGTTNFTESQITELNNTTYVYTGAMVTDDNIIPLVYSTDAVSDSDILTGKYYAGSYPVDNAEMAYTNPFSVIENRHYYMPYITFGYTWFDESGYPLGGGYTNAENTTTPVPYYDIVSPPGAVSVGISCRSGDAEILKKFSLMQNASAYATKAGNKPVVRSAIREEGLNYIYNIKFNQNRSPSRVYMTRSDVSDSWTYTGEYAQAEVGIGGCNIGSYDLVTMDKSKIAMVFSVPSGSTPVFTFGYNPFYNGLDISDGGIAIKFLSDGETAEIRSGNGENGNYGTLIDTLDISSLDILSGGLFYVSVEKDTVNRQIFTIYNAVCPSSVITKTIEAQQDPNDENVYTNQYRCWGTAYLRVISGSLNIHEWQMYSTASTYPRVAIWGDSYVENYGRNPNCGFFNLIKTALDGNVFASGRGGATAQQGLYRFNTEINTCAPQFVIVCFGVNDSFNTTVDAYKTAIQQYIATIQEKGAMPILVTVPRIDDGTLDNLTWIQSVNPWVRSSGYKYIDIANALSTGDGVTQDYNKYMPDKTHPNITGAASIFSYIKAFLPFLLFK